MAPAPDPLEADVKEARAKITALASEEATLRKSAEDLLAKKKEDNPGVNLITSKEHFTEVDTAFKAADAKKEEIVELQGRLTSMLGTETASIVAESNGDPGKVQSLAQRVIDSEAYQILAASGMLTTGSQFSMPGVNLMDVDEAMAALAPMQFLATVTDGGPLVPSDRQFLPPIAIPTRQVRLLDLITMGSTGTDTVEWTRQTTRNSQAANVAFGTAAPQSNYVWEMVTATVRRIAHEATVSRGNLADQRQLGTIINGELVRDLRLHVENQVLSGDGVGQNLLGMLNTAGIGSQALGADTIADAIHKAITVVRIALEDDITAIGLHPTDYESIILSKDAQGNYVSGMGWQDPTPRQVWGYPAVVSTLFAQGTAVAANFGRAATMWMREGISVSASSEHGTNFTEGMVTLLGETRAAFATKQPKALCEVTGL